MKASSNITFINFDVSGVNSDGLIIARFPAAKILPKGPNVRVTGKFHGLITPTVPRGWYSTLSLAPRRPKIAGVTFLFSGLTHFLIFSLALFKDPIDPATSANKELSVLL